MAELSRRRLLIGGGASIGLLVGYALWPRRYLPNLVAGEGEAVINAFLKIGRDGEVTAIVPQAEMGQGAWTSLAQLLADELGADWRTVGVEPAPIAPVYANSLLLEEGVRDALPPFLQGAGGWAAREVAVRSSLMITGGSTSIRGFEARMLEAGATARALLCMAAAARWDADWQACDTRDGFVVRGSDRLRFGELVEEAAALEPPAEVPLRAFGSGGIAGRAVPRLDLPAKVDGSARYAADVRLPEMLFASVRQRPVGGSGRLADLDLGAADKVPGVSKVVRTERWVAALADTWWAANRALDALGPRFEGAGRASTAAIEQALDRAMAGAGGRIVARGDVAAEFAKGTVFTAHFAVPPAAHAPIEPLTATARMIGDRLELWAPTQAPGLARAAAARGAGVSEGQVTLYPMQIGGGFGRKIEVDAIEQVALLAAKSQRPVQLTWSREEETVQARGRPPAKAFLAARLDGRRIVAWQARIATPSAGAEMMARLMPALPARAGHAEAGAVAGAEPPYAIPAVAIDHLPAVLPIESGMWRSVAHSYTCFFTECFVDELAARAETDPMAFRVEQLREQPRLARCLAQVAARGGWLGGGNGQGLACHSAFGSHIALLAEASAGADAVRVGRIVAAVDCGRVVHPDIVRQQIEGGIIWGMAAALDLAMDYHDGATRQRNFDTLRLPALADCPAIEIEIIASREPPGGVGELGVPPVAPAIANALAATGMRRFHSLPLKV